MNHATAPAPLVPPPRPRWRRRLGVATLLLLALLGGAAAWLFGSGAGLRFALARAEAASHGALRVQQAQGRLLGPLTLRGVRYAAADGTVVTLAQAQLDLRFWPLLAGRAHVLALSADGVDVALPLQPAPAPNTASAFPPRPPLDLQLDRVRIGSVRVTRGDQLLFAARRLDLAGRWTARGVQLDKLALQAPAGRLDLAGTLAFGAGYAGSGRADFAWQLGATAVAGQLTARSDGRRTQLALRLTRPTAARLQLTLAQTADAAWTARLDVPRFDPQPLLGAGAPPAMALALQGHGERRSGTFDGRLDLDDVAVLLQPLRAQLSADLHTLTLQQLRLHSPQIRGSVAASGTLQLDATPLRGALDLQWRDVQLPPALAARVSPSAAVEALHNSGSVQLQGSMARYRAAGEVTLGPPGKPTALRLDLDGTPQQIALHALTLQQAQGDLQAHGTLTLQPRLEWQLDARARRFDPGQLFTGWGGSLDAELASRGALTPAGTDATLAIRQLGGTLRQRAVRGSGRLHLSPAGVLDGTLALASGHSTVRLQAAAGASNRLDLSLAIASLGDWLPQAGGRLDGHFRIGGMRPALSVNGTLQGHALAWGAQRLDSLQVIAGVPDISHPAGKLDVQASGLRLDGLRFQRIHLLAEGSQRNHQLRIDARGSQLSGELALHGALRGADWHGTLATLNLAPQGLPRWYLQQPAALDYRGGALQLSELCLSAGDPRLCVAAQRDRAGTLDASYRLHALPLALLLNAAGVADLPLRVDGSLDGRGKLHRTAAGALSGSATIDSARGSVTYVDQPRAPLLRYDQLSLAATFTPASQWLQVRAGLDQNGRLDGQLSVSGTHRALAGQLDVRLHSLAFVELLSSELAQVQGRLDGSFGVAGTLAQPAITGQARVADFAAEVPAAGLKLSQGSLTISTADARQFHLAGSVRSGQGALAIGGQADLGSGALSAITLKGSRFTAADLPGAKVVLSPDLTVQRDGSGIAVGGAVTLDSAEVNLDKLPGSGATHASADVVLVDQPARAVTSSRQPIRARVRVDLGQQTHVTGAGLDGHITGVLTLNEQPGRAPTGQGQLAVSGSYRAYGQKLQIERGQLLFASTPLDNPGLNIRALRKLNPNATVDQGQQVGLQITGTARRPILSVFSHPVMEQSDALAYLITGKPLSQVRGSEGNMVNAAAQALGAAGGNLLAKSVGARLGIDDIGVSGNDALGGNSAFTVGKYLSPRLYLSYGVGLFQPGQVITLRYRLSQRWNFEAQNATSFNRASFNYRYEK